MTVSRAALLQAATAVAIAEAKVDGAVPAAKISPHAIANAARTVLEAIELLDADINPRVQKHWGGTKP